MKRIFAFLVAIVMLAGVCPAMGESLKSEMEDVVIHVRKTLGIDDNFDDFTGDKFSGLWHLDWTSEEGNVSVTCSPEGKIFSYYSYENNEPEPAPYDYAFKPSFPGAGDESIMKAADEFMTIVLDENEGWTFTEVQGGGLDRGDGESMLNGRLMLEGMLTDITIDLSVDTDTLAVTSFYRSDNYNVYRNDVVDAAVNVGADEAKAAIMDKFDMEIRYYVSDYSDMARLVYMPRTDNRFIVRASDGELINLEDAYDILWGSVTEEDAAVEYVLGAENPKELVELSDAEKAAACAYEGAMDIASLDKLARSMTELAIDEGFMLTAASYYFTDTCLVANLEYNHKLTEEELAQRLDISVEKAAEMIGQGSNRYDQKMIELNAHD